jgi:hypothetical protein
MVAIVSYVLNLVVTGDDYDPNNGTLIFDQRVGRVNIESFNAGIFYQLQSGVNGINASDNDGAWNEEVFAAPAFRSLSRAATGCRVRSALPGVPAIVTLEGVPIEDLGE